MSAFSVKLTDDGPPSACVHCVAHGSMCKYCALVHGSCDYCFMSMARHNLCCPSGDYGAAYDDDDAYE